MHDGYAEAICEHLTVIAQALARIDATLAQMVNAMHSTEIGGDPAKPVRIVTLADSVEAIAFAEVNRG